MVCPNSKAPFVDCGAENLPTEKPDQDPEYQIVPEPSTELLTGTIAVASKQEADDEYHPKQELNSHAFGGSGVGFDGGGAWV